MARTEDYLGFKTKNEYLDYCRHLVKVYEENEKMTLNSLRTYSEDEFGIEIGFYKLRTILIKFDTNLRPIGGKKYKKYSTKELRATINADDVIFIDEIFRAYGLHSRAELLEFAFAIIRGRPTKSMVLWIGDLKPVVFLYDKKYVKYRVFSEGLSKLEAKILEELMVTVENDRNLNSIKSYANEKHLQYFGANT